MKRLLLACCIVLALPIFASAQQQRRRQPPPDPNYLPLYARQQLVFENARSEATDRRDRMRNRARCGTRVEWYSGFDGFYVVTR